MPVWFEYPLKEEFEIFYFVIAIIIHNIVICLIICNVSVRKKQCPKILEITKETNTFSQHCSQIAPPQNCFHK